MKILSQQLRESQGYEASCQAPASNINERIVEILDFSPITSHTRSPVPADTVTGLTSQRRHVGTFSISGVPYMSLCYEKNMHNSISYFYPALSSLLLCFNCPRDQVQVKGMEEACWKAMKIPGSHFFLVLRKS